MVTISVQLEILNKNMALLNFVDIQKASKILADLLEIS